MNSDPASRTTLAPTRPITEPCTGAPPVSDDTPPDLSGRTIHRHGAPWASQWIEDEIAKAALYLRE